MLRLCASMLRLCPTHVATLRDPCCDFVRPMFRLCTTQASCGTMKFRSQKVHFGYPFRSQHESWNSARVDQGADLWGGDCLLVVSEDIHFGRLTLRFFERRQYILKKLGKSMVDLRRARQNFQNSFENPSFHTLRSG